MKTLDVLKFALLGLSRRRARTFLTVLGVIVGTVCIVLMFAIGLSNYQQFEQTMLADQKLTQIQISDSSYGGMGGGGGRSSGGIKDATISSIAGIKHVKAVSPVIDLSVTLKSGRYTGHLYSLKAVDPQVLDVDLEKGELFTQNSSMPQIVLDGNAVKEFYDKDNPPNFSTYEEQEKYQPDIDFLKTEWDFTLGYETEDPEMPKSQIYRAQISGITKKSFNNYDSYMDLAVAKRVVMENRDLAERLGLKIGSYREALIVVDDIENVPEVLEQVKKLGLQTYSPTEEIKTMREEQMRQQAQLFAIGFISLFVSAIGIANTMYANILERRRDIGVMKVLGMKIKKIRNLFLAESAMIGLLGGLIGIGISYIVMLLINTGSEGTSFLGMYFSAGMKVTIPVWLSLGALMIAVSVGAVSGIYPAQKATKMSPLEAMRGGN